METPTSPSLAEACARAIEQHNFSSSVGMVSSNFLHAKGNIVTITNEQRELPTAKVMLGCWGKRISKFFTSKFTIQVHVLGTGEFEKQAFNDEQIL